MSKSAYPYLSLLRKIIINDLCIRCGTCVGFCPTGCLTIDRNRLVPVIREENNCSNCGRCIKLCPAYSTPIYQLYEDIFKRLPQETELYGICQNIFIGKSNDPQIYSHSAGGGIVTQILKNLLEQKQIDGAIIAGFNNTTPYIPEGKIAYTKEELIHNSNSIYICTPVNEVFKYTRRTDKRFAVVGLPCAISAIRKAQLLYPKETKNLVVLIGLFCGINIGQEATNFYLKKKGIDKNTIIKYSTRTKKEGYGINIELSSGLKIKNKNIAIHLGLSPVFTPARCQICPDFTNEFADISVGDTWQNDGRSIVLSRTAIGDDVLKYNENLQLEKAESFNKHFSAIINKRIRSRKVLEYRRQHNEISTEFNLERKIYPLYDWNKRDNMIFSCLHSLFAKRIVKKLSKHVLVREKYLSLPIDKSSTLQYYLIAKYVLAFWNHPVRSFQVMTGSTQYVKRIYWKMRERFKRDRM